MQNSRRVSLLLAALAVSLAATARADAPGDAWAAVKNRLPANPYVVMGANFATIKGSSLYQQVVEPLIKQNGDVSRGLDLVSSKCGINVVDVVQGAVVAIDEHQKGIIVLSTKGMDAARVTDCLGKVAEADDKPKKVTASKPAARGIVECAASGESKKIYMAFLPKGVIAMATDPETKPLLERWMTGKGSPTSGPTGRALATVNTSAAVWLVVTQEKPMDPINATMKVVYGTADVGGGNVNADFRIVTATPKQAGDLAAYANKQIDDLKKPDNSAQVPPELQRVIKTVRIVPNGDEVQLKASLPEAEALSLVQAAMGGGGEAAPQPSPLK
jgi:hypothetical protein